MDVLRLLEDKALNCSVVIKKTKAYLWIRGHEILYKNTLHEKYLFSHKIEMNIPQGLFQIALV